MDPKTAKDQWLADLKDAQTMLMTLGYSVVDVLPDMLTHMIQSLNETQVFELAVRLYENSQGRKDPLTNASLLFPLGKDVVVASYLRQFEDDAGRGDDDHEDALDASAEAMNACVRATNLLEFLEKQRRLDKSGPFGNRDEQCGGDIQPGLQGLRQMVIAWVFGSPAPLDTRVVDEARPYIRSNDEVSCNKLLARLSSSAPRTGSSLPAFALSFLGTCGLSKPWFIKRFKSAHEQIPTNLYRALHFSSVLGPGFYEAKSKTDSLVSALHKATGGASPILHYARLLEERVLGEEP